MKMKDELRDLIQRFENVNSYDGLMEIGRELMNFFMSKERDAFLEKSSGNKANGFYSRDLITMFGPLSLLIPRDRKGEFRSKLLPDKWQRSDPTFGEFILKLVLQSYSPNTIKALLDSLDLPYSPDKIEEIKNDLYAKAMELRNSELPEDSFAIFIDAYHAEIKDEKLMRVRKAVIYVVIGIDLNWNKTLYGYYIFWGSETKGDWLQIFNDLINRGLKRVLLVVSDDFPGLDSALRTLFPKTDHQLCFVHLQRNVLRNMAKSDALEFNKELKIIKLSRDYDSAVDEFKKLCQKYLSKYPAFMKILISKAEKFLSFLKYPEPVRKHIYTTNIVENFNSRIEVGRINSGGYFQSLKTADIVVYLVYSKLKDGKWKKPLFAFSSVSYEIKQLFNLRFQTQFS